jgi:hypothetical protein
MAFPQALVTRFFQLINNHKITEAHRQLQRIKQQMPKKEWDHGYYKALQGILLTRKTNGNQYAFLPNLNPNDKASIKQYRDEFSKRVKSRFYNNFDRGFFSAWTDYTQLLIKTIEESKPKTDPEGQTSIAQYAESIQKSA